MSIGDGFIPLSIARLKILDKAASYRLQRFAATGVAAFLYAPNF